MSIPGGIRVKLALALLGIVGGALLAAYAIVVPSLELRLVDAKLDQLQSDAEALAVNYALNQQRLDDFVGASAFVSNARVVVFDVTDPPRNEVLRSLADSSPVGRFEIENDPAALEAAKGAGIVRSRIVRDGREYAEVATTLLANGNVMLLSSSLEDQLATVALVKRRLLYATIVALLIAVTLGFALATVHARRLGRIQKAADRIAEGAFDASLVDRGNDEVGQLANSSWPSSIWPARSSSRMPPTSSVRRSSPSPAFSSFWPTRISTTRRGESSLRRRERRSIG